MDNANAVVILLTFSSDLASRVRNSKKVTVCAGTNKCGT